MEQLPGDHCEVWLFGILTPAVLGWEVNFVLFLMFLIP